MYVLLLVLVPGHAEEHKTPSMHIFQILEKNVKRKSANTATFHKSKLNSLMSPGNVWDVYTQDRRTLQLERTECKRNCNLTETLKPFL